MTKRSWKVAFAVAAIAAAGACGGNNGETNNGGTNNGATNNGSTNNGSTNNGTGSNNGTSNNGTSNNGTSNNGETNNNGVTPIEEPPGCDDPNPPARCSEDPSTITWAPASVMTEFVVAGTDSDPVCCFDYTDDGNIDNALGTSLATFMQLTSINSSVKTNIDDGSLVLVLEHDGLDAADNDDAFTANFYIGEHEGTFTAFAPSANPVLLNPASFDQGAQPQAYLPNASVTGGAVVAGPGSVKIEVELFESPLSLLISQARIEADVDAANSGLDATGVSLVEGELGGVVRVEDVFVAVNEFAANCPCLGLGTEALVDLETGTCNTNADAQACTDAGETTCGEVGGSCDILSAVGLVADVDLDGDGVADAISLGATFSAAGAEIKGLAP